MRRWVMSANAGGALVLCAYSAFLPSGSQAARDVVAITLGGLVTSALVALLVERCMRPLFAEVLAGDAAVRPAVLGIRARLLLSWALGSGVFLLAIALAPLGLSRSRW